MSFTTYASLENANDAARNAGYPDGQFYTSICAEGWFWWVDGEDFGKESGSTQLARAELLGA